MNTFIIFQIQSFSILLLIFVGVYYRILPSRHVKIMGVAITWDILLILQIELSRQAVETALKVATNTLALNIHVAFAVSTVLVYGALVYTGRQLLRRNYDLKRPHKFLGISAIVLRTATLITSFWANWPKLK